MLLQGLGFHPALIYNGLIIAAIGLGVMIAGIKTSAYMVITANMSESVLAMGAGKRTGFNIKFRMPKRVQADFKAMMSELPAIIMDLQHLGSTAACAKWLAQPVYTAPMPISTQMPQQPPMQSR